ncbi:MAG: hypothetical protein CVV11_19990 [Gammaproteobacteria bacterium HGW-Gammaproteobacteria-15]|nr:MAG: hypothetical protein CVV11_19990 [Gammaproteobacteria bacterium HGW-Gammaproteobacteria-15]
MRPSKLKPGAKILYTFFGNEEREGIFIRRQPSERFRQPAVNFIRFPHLAGVDGPQDDGTCQISDYDLSRKGRQA